MPCPICGQPLPYPMPYCQYCGSPLLPPGYGPAAAPKSVQGLGITAAVLFGLEALAELATLITRGATSSPLPVAGAISDLLILALTPVFIVWLFRVRHNAGLWGPQRRAQGWAIGAWFTPVVNLWFPYQIAADAATPQQLGPAGRGVPGLVRGWWAAWILSWLTGFHAYDTTTTSADGRLTSQSGAAMSLGATSLSVGVTAVAAVLGLLMVLRLSAAQEARIAAGSGTYFHYPMPTAPPTPPFIGG